MISQAETITAKELSDILNVVKTTVLRRSEKEGWQYQNGRNMERRFPIQNLPSDVQKRIAAQIDLSPAIIPVLAPEAALAAAGRMAGLQSPKFELSYNNDTWTDDTAISMDVLRDPQVSKWARIIQEAEDVPAGWKKRAWVDAVAVKHNTTTSTIYRKISKYKKTGLAGLKHTKSNRKQPKTWTPEAIDWWVGLVLKRDHRKIAKDALYDILVVEAGKRGWDIGCYESALWWLKKKINPQLLALQRGGSRALDNTLPPVLRDYSDLAPFEILVGDQHKFDFWVIDDETGEVFRPEGYFWQDLRTRCLYGGALDKKYDSYLIGLALRMGLKIFGAFGSIYTDNGKPELSRYTMGIMKDMRTLGLNIEKETDVPLDISQAAPDEINPCAIMPGTHKKAIVKNAKAKMIEGTFNVLEGILRDHFRLPGHVKDLSASGEEQDIDEKEKERLARSGKLPTFWEFVSTLFKAMDYYNGQKAHRGVLKEWKWRPKPKAALPMDCLKACYMDGWRPGPVSEEAIDLIFLPRATRVCDRGRVAFRKTFYEHEKLIGLHKKRVEIRFDPLDPDWLLVFYKGDYVCRAEPVEYSSMKDQNLASRKIEEKSRRRKGFIMEYRAFTSTIPDFREYSKVPAIEKAAALVGRDSKRKLAEQNDLYRERSSEELAQEVAQIEDYEEAQRPVFRKKVDRDQWCLDQEALGQDLAEKDRGFVTEYEAEMDADTMAYWTAYKGSLAVNSKEGVAL